MIRINLLGVPKKTTRGGRRASTVAATGGGEGSSTVILGLIVNSMAAFALARTMYWKRTCKKRNWKTSVWQTLRRNTRPARKRPICMSVGCG